MNEILIDSYGRKIDYVRISVTKRCGFSCIYCNPNGEHCLEDELNKDEIVRIAKIFADCGIDKIRLTGGEPLVRQDIIEIVRELKAIPKIKSVTLTTNAERLSEYVMDLKTAGLDGVNISLDSMSEDIFRQITGSKSFKKVLNGIETAYENDLKIKINTVPIRGINEKDILSVAEIAKKRNIDVRFIELMPMTCNNMRIDMQEIKEILDNKYGNGKYAGKTGSGPAQYFTYQGFTGKIGFISAVTHKFCTSCNRVRLTSDGELKLCLCYDSGINLRNLLEKDDNDIKNAVIKAVKQKPECHDFEINDSSHDRGMWKFGG